MAITMKKITTELMRSLVDEFLPVGEALRVEGMGDNRIMGAFNDYCREKQTATYNKAKEPKPIGESIAYVMDQSKQGLTDSKIERIFYDLLDDSKVGFRFQRKIGKYRVDFLIDGWLIFEIDGPHHKDQVEYDKKRDHWLNDIGYQVWRVPAWLAATSPAAVVAQIMDMVETGGKTE